MSVKRTYGDNGELLRYEMSKEMKARGVWYANKCKRNQVIDTVMPFIISIAAGVLLAAWYLMNN